MFLNTSLKTERESVRRQERTQESYRFLSCVKGISTDTCHILTQPMRTTMTDRKHEAGMKGCGNMAEK